MKFLGLFFLLNFPFICFSQNKILFEKKKNPKSHYEISIPAYCDVIFLNGKIGGYISDVRDSVLVMRIFNPGKIENVKEKIAEAKRIKKDRSLSKREREAKLVKYLYRDSVQLPLSAVMQMRFYSAQKRSKYFLVAAASFLIATAMTELYVNNIPPPSEHDLSSGFYLIAGFSVIYFVDYNLFVKRIN